MSKKDGRDAKEAYRVRVGGTWYWVDPTVPASELEPGNTVVIYPVDGEAHLAVLHGALEPGQNAGASFAALDGERFELPAGTIVTLHLAAEDDEQ